MTSAQQTYATLMQTETIGALGSDAALDHISLLTDLSWDLREPEGLERAIQLGEELRRQALSPSQLATSHYVSANAWASLRALRVSQSADHWEWEQPETEKEIIHLRHALQGEEDPGLPRQRLCQILTNLANALDRVGRFVEALEYWDRALALQPSFAMALGNKGIALTHYALALYDEGHACLLLKRAHAHLVAALNRELHAEPRAGFEAKRSWIESVLSSECVAETVDIDRFSLGSCRQEVRYRRWCLSRRLFLNPLNDLGPHSIAARDVLTSPSIAVGLREGPYYHGFFNQMKQEFVSARYLYYEAAEARVVHFSDRDVLLYNTLDYPAYSLSVEKAKAAFRMVYSLLDKMAFFLNHYLSLAIPDRRVTFRALWYEGEQRRKGVRTDLEGRDNWPLRGLFWLSKDLFEARHGFRECLEPDARDLQEVRNHLEHKYLKLHEDPWPGPPDPSDEAAAALADTLAFSLRRADFEAKVLRLLKAARAALIYLSLAVHREEQFRASQRPAQAIVPPLALQLWEDDWKS